MVQHHITTMETPMTQATCDTDTLLPSADVARQLGVAPRLLADLFWQGKIDHFRCPVIRRRRLIPKDYVPEIKAILVRLGHLPAAETVA
jgi:hypothetical protein